MLSAKVRLHLQPQDPLTIIPLKQLKDITFY